MQELVSSRTASVFSFSGDGISEKIMSFLSARELSSLRGVNKLFKRCTLEFVNYLIDCINKTNHSSSSSSSSSSATSTDEAARFKHLEDISNQNQTIFLICGYSDPYVKLNQLIGLTRFEASSCRGSDVKKLSWKAGGSPSISRYGFGSCVHNGEIWICCGGNAYSEDLGSVERYDVGSMKWSRLHSKLMGSGRELITSASLVSYKGNLLQIGGFYDPSSAGSDDEFDATSLRFVEHISIMREGSSSSLSSYSATTTNVDDNIASVFSKADLSTSSSSAGGGVPSSAAAFADASNKGVATIDRANAFFEVYSEMGRLNVSRADPGLTVFNNKLYVCGGFSVNSDSPNEMEALKSVEYFDEDSKLWVLMEESMLCGRYGSSFTVGPISNELYAIGGEMSRMDEDENPEALLTIEKLDKVTKKWVYVTSFPSARADSCASIVGTSIYIFGGGPSMEGGDVSNWDRYCTKTNTWLSASASIDKTDRSFPSYRMFEEHNHGSSQLYPVSSLSSRAVTWPPNSATYPDDN